MPLIKSKSNKARSENIRREIEAGKPRAQAAAIGYSVQREAKKKSHSTKEGHMKEHKKEANKKALKEMGNELMEGPRVVGNIVKSAFKKETWKRHPEHKEHLKHLKAHHKETKAHLKHLDGMLKHHKKAK